MMQPPYEPNLSDRRVLRRLKTAVPWARATLSTRKSRPIRFSSIDKALGRNNLGLWLRENLLVCMDDEYNMLNGVAKAYILNKPRYEKLKKMMQSNRAEDDATFPVYSCGVEHDSLIDGTDWFTSDVHFVLAGFSDEVKSLNFDFEQGENSARLYHSLQNVPRVVKPTLWNLAGLPFDYDVSQCAPNLIHQHAQMNGMDLWLDELQGTLRDKNEFRQYVSNLTGLPIEKSKRIISALFCGARLSSNKKYSSLYKLIDFDLRVMRALQGDDRLKRFRADIRTCWEYIEPTMTRIRSDKGRLKPVSPAQKWNRYFELERKVLNVVVAHLKDTKNRYFLEHDGWRTERPIDVEIVTDLIRQKTGFNLRIE